MRKSESIILALVTITLGVLLIAWHGDIIHVLMTVLGIALVVLGVLDLIERDVKLAGVKVVLGILAVAFGWLLVSAVAYILATAAVLFAVYLTIDFFKKGNKICLQIRSVVGWLKPICFVLIGLFLFLNGGGKADWAFVLTGVITVLLGGVLLMDGLVND